MADGSGAIGFLGVARSLTGRVWRPRPADADLVVAHQRTLELSEPLARALASRRVAAHEGADYLTPTLKALFPDPSSFMDMDLAVEAILDAVVAEKKVWVFADYDVDGASSAALLVRWFRAMGAELSIYVPDRITEGYGPSIPAFANLKAAGADLVITVDCGAAAHGPLEAAAAMGLEVVVIDHHMMRGAPPACRAVVNPNRPDCVSGQGWLAAAGVCFVLLAALNREARRRGLFETRREPRILDWLDLAAMGAVCDVTELRGFNRALTARGLEVMSAWGNPGLKALMEVAGASGTATTFHAGFILGPRINAGGRIGRADLGARLLSTDDYGEALEIARELDALNATRKDVEREVLEAAVRVVEHGSNHGPEGPVVVVAGEGWHPGVIGIVAGRLRERWRKPVIVIGLDPVTGMGKGSGRSQTGINLGKAVQGAYDAGLLLAGGGHAMAAGLTVRGEDVPDLRAYLADHMQAEATEAFAADALEIDAVVTPRGADRPLLSAFDRMAPFGPGNPEPMFAVAGVRAEQVMPLRGGHLRCVLVDADGSKLKAIAWRAADTPIGERLMAGGGAVHAAGKLKPDDWKGRDGVQMEIEDLADPRMA